MEFSEARESLLGTAVEIKLPRKNSGLFSACFGEMKRIERAYSRFLPGSTLSRLNSELGEWHDASEEMLFLLEEAAGFNSRTEGNFDITLKSALDDLGYDSKYSFEPKTKPDRSIAPGDSRNQIQIDKEKRRVLLNKEIDFGGFGKGHALDKVGALLESQGVSHYYINAGGDILAKRAPEAPPWTTLLEHPDDPERAIGKMELDGRSIAGSAPNRRKWGNFHHLLNAKTGLPAEGAKAIFVLAKRGIEADAYATAIFTAGFRDGIALSQRLPVEILFVSSENKMYRSPGFPAELFG